MARIRNSIATRLALANGALVGALIIVASAVFYFGTVVVLDRGIDGKIRTISNRLVSTYGTRPIDDLSREIDRELTDGIDSDTEIFLVTSASGRSVVGNLSKWPGIRVPLGQLVSQDVIRDGRPSSARLMVQLLPSGGMLYVGRDLSEQRAIRSLVIRALGAGAGISLILVILGAIVFRRQIEARIGAIRITAGEIEAGHLSRRILISGDDEFARLGVDINRMLDRIEHLMDGVRHVSNAIAHDLRTPLSRLRTKLDEALRGARTVDALSEATQTAIGGIDELILVFNKLLQIAEAESGMRTVSFEILDLAGIVHDMVDLYDAAAEEKRVQLRFASEGVVSGRGDHDLLASAVASLLDNAVKYAGTGATVTVSARVETQGVAMSVQDNGPGIPDAELIRVTERFYRLDQSRGLPGNGLGLAIVSAIATLHGGQLRLEDASPGLRATILLPPVAASRISTIGATHLSNL